MKARRFGTLIGLVLLCAVLWILTPHFLTVSNLLNIVQQTSINAIVAAGMTFVIISGGIDLSVGSIVALSGVVLGVVLQMNQPPFIVTLGMMSVARGAALVFTEGRPVSGFDENFRSIATGNIAAVPAPVIVMLIVYAIA